MPTPSAPRSHRRSGPLLALAAVVLGGLTLVEIEPRDDAWLLVVGGHAVDAQGWVKTAWDDLGRSCGAVTASTPDAASPAWSSTVQALRDFSPPDSHSARIERAQALGPWSVLQARFDALESVVVVVREDERGAQVWPQAVWSGTALPWHAPWRIRKFLRERAPEVPGALLDCLDPLPVFSQPPRPLQNGSR